MCGALEVNLMRSFAETHPGCQTSNGHRESKERKLVLPDKSIALCDAETGYPKVRSGPQTNTRSC